MLAHKRIVWVLAGTVWLAFASAGFAGPATKAMLKLGKAQFDENCAVCHQADAIGKPGLAPSLTNPELLGISSDKFMMATIRDGRADTSMMPFAHLGRKNVRAIVAYLRLHAKGPTDPRKSTPSPTPAATPASASSGTTTSARPATASTETATMPEARAPPSAWPASSTRLPTASSARPSSGDGPIHACSALPVPAGSPTSPTAR